MKFQACFILLLFDSLIEIGKGQETEAEDENVHETLCEDFMISRGSARRRKGLELEIRVFSDKDSQNHFKNHDQLV